MIKFESWFEKVPQNILEALRQDFPGQFGKASARFAEHDGKSYIIIDGGYMKKQDQLVIEYIEHPTERPWELNAGPGRFPKHYHPAHKCYGRFARVYLQFKDAKKETEAAYIIGLAAGAEPLECVYQKVSVEDWSLTSISDLEFMKNLPKGP